MVMKTVANAVGAFFALLGMIVGFIYIVDGDIEVFGWMLFIGAAVALCAFGAQLPDNVVALKKEMEENAKARGVQPPYMGGMQMNGYAQNVPQQPYAPQQQLYVPQQPEQQPEQPVQPHMPHNPFVNQ